MAKAKAQKGSAGGAQSHLRARTAYLYQASLLLQSVHDPSSTQLQVQAARAAVETQATPAPGENAKLLAPFHTPQLLEQDDQPSSTEPAPNPHSCAGRPSYLARQYASQLKTVSLKSQLRLPRSIKHSLCKRCDTLLIPGSTCSKYIENKSRGGKKPWADVLVVKCGVCGTAKRYPQSQKRGMKLVDCPRDAGDAVRSEVPAG
ncbi:ribonuclease P subunit [Emydomyces testavorans]|uniref:Ribonuclease P subunit n=1 Tax=Emydomyces testavorans TaxID=2070801 RepID=A0AAF0IL75_9EURO|nr:ribonuclease P subunit [Emydomyces testavorans]